MNIEKEFDTRFKNVLTNTVFAGALPDWWYKAAHRALRYTSPMGLGISALELREIRALVSMYSPLNCYQFAIVNNNMVSRTPVELALTDMDYDEVMIKVDETAIVWHEQTTELRNQVNISLDEDLKNLKQKTADKLKRV